MNAFFFYKTLRPMPIHCDNQKAIIIAQDFAFHQGTKDIEIDSYLIREKVLMRVISGPHVSSLDQLTDIFTKSIIGVSYDCLGSKLGLRGSVRYSLLAGLVLWISQEIQS